MTNAQGVPPQTLSDDQLRTLAYFAIGVASEGSHAGRNVAYQLSFAGNTQAGVMTPIGNSGFSIGTLQTDLGQHPAVATRLVDSYQHWAAQQTPPRTLSAAQREQTVSDLQRDGNAIRADNGRAMDATVQANLNTFLGSPQGITFVHDHDRTQVDRLLRPGDGQRDLGGAMQQLQNTALYARSSLDDQAKLATMLMKLENQAGTARYPGVLRGIDNGTLNSVDDIKTRIDGMLPNRMVRGQEVPDYLESGVEHALKGTEVFNKLRGAGQDHPLNAMFNAVSANPLANPVDLSTNPGDQQAMHRYEAVKTLFLQNNESPAFIDALESGRDHAWGRPQPEGRSAATAGLYAAGNDVVIWNRDGQGHALINGAWSQAPRAELHRQRNEDGTTDLSRNAPGAEPIRLLHVDPRRQERLQGAQVPHLEGDESRLALPARADPLFQQASDAVRRMEEGLGRPFDQTSERLAASSACLARASGLTRVDHVVLSNATASARQGETVFVVQGALDDPAQLRAQMPTVQAIAASTEQSLDRLQSMNDQRREQQLAQGTEQDPQLEASRQHRSV